MELGPAKIVAYHCRNLRLFQNGNQKTFSRSMPGLRLVAIPCSGKLEAHHLLETLAAGAEGVRTCLRRKCMSIYGRLDACAKKNRLCASVARKNQN